MASPPVEIASNPASYRGSHGQLTLFNDHVKYQTADGKKVSFPLSSVKEAAPLDKTGDDGVVTHCVNITTETQGKAKPMAFGFTSNSSRSDRDLWTRKLLAQVDALRNPGASSANLISSVSSAVTPVVSTGSSSGRRASVKTDTSAANQDSYASQQQQPVLPVIDPRTEGEKRALLLTANPDLKQVYEDLVHRHGTLTEQEFWAARKELLPDISDEEARLQKTGIGNAWVTDLNPIVGDKSIEFNLNANVIYDILATYPAIRRAYQENVPHKVTEDLFWGEVLRSHYFNRPNDPSKVTRSEFLARYEDVGPSVDPVKEMLKKQNESGQRVFLRVNPTVDLTVEDSGRISFEEDINDDKVHRTSNDVIKKLKEHAKLVLSEGDVKDKVSIDPKTLASNSNGVDIRFEEQTMEDLLGEQNPDLHELDDLKSSNLSKKIGTKEYFREPSQDELMTNSNISLWARVCEGKDIDLTPMTNPQVFDIVQNLSLRCQSMHRASQAQSSKNPNASLYMFSFETQQNGNIPVQFIISNLRFRRGNSEKAIR
jgi:hypothetical protein